MFYLEDIYSFSSSLQSIKMKALITIILFTVTGLSLFSQKINAETSIPGEKAIEGVNTDNSSSSSYGLFGRSYHGLQVFADGTTGYAGVGTANGANGIGFYGIAAATGGKGILGLHTNIAGAEPGVEGRSDSRSGNAAGVLGEITSTEPGSFSAGVRGINKGLTHLGIGVYGSHDGHGWGVYGTVPEVSLGWGGFFRGGHGLYASPKVGINTTTPEVELVVTQRIAADNVFDAKLLNLTGLMIETVNDTAVLMYVDPVDDLNFAFGSGTNFMQKAYIWRPTGDFVTFSDRRLKENIAPMGGVLNKVLQLRPSQYSFKDDKTENPSIGFIAQDVQTLFPEIVQEKNGRLALTYDKFAVLAIKAIIEQQEIIEELSKRLTLVELKECTEK